MKIILFSAQMQNGKDTAADYLYSKLNGWKRSLCIYFLKKIFPNNIVDYLCLNLNVWKRASFAYFLKKLFSDTFKVDSDFIDEWKVKSEIPPGFDMTVRKALQFIGDGFRQIKSDIWIDLAFRNIKGNAIFSDGRYMNEVKKVKELDGINILIYREGFENDDPNGSEAQLKPILNFFKNLNGGKFEGSTKEIFSQLNLNELTALPPGVLDFDMFLRNDGTVEDFQTKIDNLLIPYIRGHYAD